MAAPCKHSQISPNTPLCFAPAADPLLLELARQVASSASILTAAAAAAALVVAAALLLRYRQLLGGQPGSTGQQDSPGTPDELAEMGTGFGSEAAASSGPRGWGHGGRGKLEQRAQLLAAARAAGRGREEAGLLSPRAVSA